MKLLICLFLFLAQSAYAQTATLKGIVKGPDDRPLTGVNVSLGTVSLSAITDKNGAYILEGITPGSYKLIAYLPGMTVFNKEMILRSGIKTLDIQLKGLEKELKAVEIEAGKEDAFGSGRLNNVEGVSIYAGKKTEVVNMEQVAGNLATNNSREIYSRVTGLNIWESDRAGLQLGIGGRGLNPNRVSNFNTRQNGYDISADALGYPESYYTPPSEALDRIEIVRGAASLQYGSQFGGFINFRLKDAPAKPLEIQTRQTVGSWNLFNSFNSIGGQLGGFSYYGFYQHKQGDGWRPNSQFNNNTGYLNMGWRVNQGLSFKAEYTGMHYLAQQPGGLTDQQFEEDPRRSFRERNWFRVDWNLLALSGDLRITPMLTLNSRAFVLKASREALGILSFINRVDPMEERDLLVDTYDNFGNETRLMLKYPVKDRMNVLLVGGRYYQGNTQRKQGLGPAGSVADFSFLNPEELEHSEYEFPSENIAVFAEHIFQLSKKVSITPGLRWEHIFTSGNGYYREEYRDFAGNIIFSRKVNDQRENNRSFLLYGAGLSYKPAEHREYYANFSRNYRSISFNDMRIVNPNFRVDPGLKDEQGFTADAGVRGRSGEKFIYEATAFYLRYEDRIGSVLRLDSTLYNLYRYRTNISDSRNIGIEAMAEADILRWIKPATKNHLTLFGNVSLIDARYVDSEESAVQDKMVEFVPRLLFRTGAGWKTKNWKVNFQWGYTSKQYTDATNSEFTANAVNGIIPAYHVADLSAAYLFKKLQVTAGINNLFDRKYFTRRADGYPGPGIIPSDGLSVYGSIAYRFSLDTKKGSADVK